MTSLVVRSDAGCLPLANDSVDLIVTSPPYFGLRSYTDSGEHYEGQVGAETSPHDYLDALLACTAEWLRVLNPTGSLWVNLGDKYVADNRGSGSDRKRGEAKHAPAGPAGFVGRDMARQKSLMGLPWRYVLRCLDELDLILRAEVIWSKPNGLPESVTDRVRRSHEQWFHLTAGPRYYSDIDQVREPYATATAARYAQGFGSDTTSGGKGRLAGPDYSGVLSTNPLGKIPGSVWTIPSAPLKGVPGNLTQHFAAFPPEWPRRLILGWSPPDGVVLDPFGGTGTTALVAAAHGRTGISVDLSADYCRLAQWRTTDPKQRSKVAPDVSPAQLSLDGVA